MQVGTNIVEFLTILSQSSLYTIYKVSIIKMSREQAEISRIETYFNASYTKPSKIIIHRPNKLLSVQRRTFYMKWHNA